MKPIVCSVQVNADPARTFAIFTDLHHAEERVEGIKKMEVLTDGPVGKGTRFKETRVMFKKETSETMEITAFDPPTGYTVEAESCGCHYTSFFKFVPKDGGTQVTWEFNSKPLTFMAKMMSPMMIMMGGTLRKLVAKDMADIKAAAEQGITA